MKILQHMYLIGHLKILRWVINNINGVIISHISPLIQLHIMVTFYSSSFFLKILLALSAFQHLILMFILFCLLMLGISNFRFSLILIISTEFKSAFLFLLVILCKKFCKEIHLFLVNNNVTVGCVSYSKMMQLTTCIRKCSLKSELLCWL